MKISTNQYIFITTEGETVAPNIEYSVDNCQVLGIVDADSEENAIQKLVQDNPWIELSGFNAFQSRCLQVLTGDIRNDIHLIVDYLWRDEERHYEEQFDEEQFDEEQLDEERENHIFSILKRLSKI